MTGSTLLLGLLLAADPGPGRLDLEPDDLKPGLAAQYRSVSDVQAKISRIEAKPAFALGRSSPHPRLPTGPFEATWTGVVSIRDVGPIQFSAYVGGELTVTVDGVEVLNGRGMTDTARITAKEGLKRPSGYYQLSIRYRSLLDVPARLQLWWESPTFAREPIPAWRFAHIAAKASPELVGDELAAKGRLAVGQLGCARCHAGAFPAVADAPPGPSLADATRRLGKSWLMRGLAGPAKVRADAHMPALFAADLTGFVERWIIADTLAGKRPDDTATADHRRGRQIFLSVGCVACHFIPDVKRAEQKELGQIPLTGLGDRMSLGDLAAFLGNPHGRYPDGRMPRLAMSVEEARMIAAYLLLWAKPSPDEVVEPPTEKELQDVVKKLGARNLTVAAATLLRDKGCVACHTGIGESRPLDVPIRSLDGGCMSGKAGPRFAFTDDTRKAIAAYLAVAGREKHPSPFAARQHRLHLAGCVRCHQRDSDKLPPLEVISSTLGGAYLQEVPFLRTPRLTNPHRKFVESHLLSAVRESVSGLRFDRFLFRMPAFGADASELVQALAEADGELVGEPEPAAPAITDPTLGTLHGSRLVGFQGFSCASCHVWNGKLLASPDPGATGPDLTRTAGRIRRDWFDRYLEGPLRFNPNTPMPAIFQHGQMSQLTMVLDGDVRKQKDALWAYLSKGKDAPAPTAPPPLPLPAPAAGEPALVAQIPLRFPDLSVVESISVLTADHDLVVYDLATAAPHSVFVGGQILRNVQARIRQFLAAGTMTDLSVSTPLTFADGEPTDRILLGYDRLPDGVHVRWQYRFGAKTTEIDDTVRVVTEKGTRRLLRELAMRGMTGRVEVRSRHGKDVRMDTISPNKERLGSLTIRHDLPPAKGVPPWELASLSFPDAAEGSLTRPGYRAIAYPRPKTVSGEDRVMPSAVAVRPRDGQVFVASMKTGELFALRDHGGDGKDARFENYALGAFQDALSMLADDDALYVLHRRNLTKITEKDGHATRFDRVAALPHGVADTYDMAYGLARDKAGRFVFGYAPYSNRTMPGSGGAIRVQPGKPPEELAYGFRNPLGWVAGTDGEIFVTDNQGEWIASNKLVHAGEGKFLGYPNPDQRQHTTKPFGKTTIWVPYAWAQSINGVAYDSTAGKFGPFAGQFFLAELMYGGAVVRANVEKVNGVYQGACFPFWGKGLLGPVTLAFDPKGPLYVGGITEPGWMAMPDRGALFRIDFTGKMPFEMQSIHVRPQGFRVVFTLPVDKATAANPASYKLESYRYEYTGAYGSPELDRAAVKVERVEVAENGLSAELRTAPLIADRVYLINASGVRSTTGEPLVHSTGAYTLNEIPAK